MSLLCMFGFHPWRLMWVDWQSKLPGDPRYGVAHRRCPRCGKRTTSKP